MLKTKLDVVRQAEWRGFFSPDPGWYLIFSCMAYEVELRHDHVRDTRELVLQPKTGFTVWTANTWSPAKLGFKPLDAHVASPRSHRGINGTGQIDDLPLFMEVAMRRNTDLGPRWWDDVESTVLLPILGPPRVIALRLYRTIGPRWSEKD